MNESISQLQDLINKRAKARLHKDLEAINDFVRGNRLLSDTSSGMPYLTFDMLNEDEDNGKKAPHKGTKHPYYVFQYVQSRMGGVNSSAYMDNVFNYWLPIYIEEETKQFMDQVTRLQNDVHDLLADPENINEY